MTRMRALYQHLPYPVYPPDSQGPGRREIPPITEDAWFEEKGRQRGIDFSR